MPSSNEKAYLSLVIFHFSFSIFIAICYLKHKRLPTMGNEKWKMINDK